MEKRLIFIKKNGRKRIHTKRFDGLAFMLVGFNFQNFAVVPINRIVKFNGALRKSCWVVVIFHVSYVRQHLILSMTPCRYLGSFESLNKHSKLLRKFKRCSNLVT